MASRALLIAADRKNLVEVRHFIVETLTAWHMPRLVIDKLRLAVDEAASNVIVHGYQDRDGDIEIRLDRAPDRLTVVIRDHAPPFDPTVVACPELGHTLLGELPGGLGLSLIRQAVDGLRYCIADDGANELTLIKSLGDTP